MPGLLRAVPANGASLCLRPGAGGRTVARFAIRRYGKLRDGPFWMFCGGMAGALTPRPAPGLWLTAGLRWDWEDACIRWGCQSVPFRTLDDLLHPAGNMMFLPFGLFPRPAVAGITGTAWWAVCHGVHECWQLLVGRAFDIDDLWLNTLGAMSGFRCHADRATAPAGYGEYRVTNMTHDRKHERRP